MTVKNTSWCAGIIAAAVAFPGAAYAQSVERIATSLTDTLQTVIDEMLPEDVTNIRVGLGPGFYPAYEGSDDYKLQPVPVVSLRYKNLIEVDNNEVKIIAFKRLFSSGTELGKGRSLRIGPLVSLNFGRGEGDSPDLAGTGNVGTSLELGAFVSYTFGQTRLRLRARQDVISGHKGATAIADITQTVFRTGRVTLSANAAGSWVSDNYMKAYFGITPTQSANSGLPVYTPGSGFKDVRATLNGNYAFSAQWSVNASAGYERLIGKAADSPLVAIRGSKNQFTLSTFVIYSF